jgi:hypothetical protein
MGDCYCCDKFILFGNFFFVNSTHQPEAVKKRVELLDSLVPEIQIITRKKWRNQIRTNDSMNSKGVL